MKDNFSQQAVTYAVYRPQYPQELFDFIVSFVKERNYAWDCGTGNGQSARVLCNYFETVFATDISQQQIDNAFRAPNIYYSVQPAEKTAIPSNSIDLITISQALHWFNFNLFYAEVKRVAKPQGIIAAWTYSLLKISNDIDKLISTYHDETIGKYWDAERKYVDDHYSSVPFPFKKIETPVFAIEYNWTIKDLEGYLNTWSALQKFITTENYSPVPALIENIKPLWGKAEKLKMIFPIHLLMAYVNGS